MAAIIKNDKAVVSCTEELSMVNKPTSNTVAMTDDKNIRICIFISLGSPDHSIGQEISIVPITHELAT